MFIEERQSLIMEKIRKEGRAEVIEIARELGVSVDTVRRDLRALEEQGRIVRTHGGAIPADSQPETAPFRDQSPKEWEISHPMAQKAAGYIEDNESIFLDGSSSVLDIIPLIKPKRDFLIYTCSPFIAAKLIEIDPEGRMELIGGRLCVTSENAFGMEAITRIERLNPDKVILGSCALSRSGRLSTVSPDDASIRQLLLQKGKEILFLLDPKMWGKELLIDLGEVPPHCRIISDQALPAEAETLLRESLGRDPLLERV